MKVLLQTLGCKVNQAEGEAIACTLRRRGISLVSAGEEADICVVNTCTVTSKSDQKCRRAIRFSVKENPHALIIITGCYAELDGPYLSRIAENVVVVPQHRKAVLLDMFDRLPVKAFLDASIEEKKAFITGFLETREERSFTACFRFYTDDVLLHSRAFLKVQDGCSYRCTYCRVPLARGPSISLSPQEIIRRIRFLEEKGFREIVCTGINITDYCYGSETLVSLLKRILAEVRSARIRLTSLEPERIDNELADVLSDTRICSHFHLPVQSGSDRILGGMKRRYNAERVRETVRLLRAVKPDCFIGADIIVGFPGEGDEDFALTRELITSCALSALHVFPFSPRKGTEAWLLTHRVKASVVKKRVAELLSLSKILSDTYISGFRGKRVRVILEKSLYNDDNGKVIFQGLSDNYIRLSIAGIPEKEAVRGRLAEAVIEKTGDPVNARFCRMLI
ncbi:MAG: tRNA (N(6)-L-threonylcarbamoyladenosine(37)-C(2))-methylthiotransferase MtaB [Spirochaetales bacterium]|nr:tRNA (N(6)-L-threonylcarbamoyladenosine(37)-C(2))-methylthiotransferase MtaB [Spirochaetales bacterium]